MQLTVIGSGTAAPEAGHVCSGFLLHAAGSSLLMDCGGGVVHSMARIGVAWQDITHLLLTHFHNDHIGDVPLLFFAWKHGMRPPRSRPLTVVGPRGTQQLLDGMASVFGSHMMEPPFDVDVRELAPGDELRLDGGVRLRTVKTRHTDESIGYRVESGAASLCYPGDTGMSEEVGRFARGADALLLECAATDDEPMEIHLSPAEVAAMAGIAKPRRLLVTHVYPWVGRGDVAEQIRAGGWDGEVSVVRDGDDVALGLGT